jgi:VanZ family protein
MLNLRIFSYRWLAYGWLVFISILFILPGSAIPHSSWFTLIYLDKWVHIFLFAVLVFLWRSALLFPRHAITLVALSLSYGILVEFVQEYWVPNRSFDVYDMAADLAGSILGILIWGWGKKNKPL